jgi:hypothetical protein
MKWARRRAAGAFSIRCHHFAVLMALIATCVGAPCAFGDAAATSSRTARSEAMRAIPWRQISPQYRRAAQAVVTDPSIYRRLPTRVIDCDPELFTFLLQHPEVVIDVWHVMGISQVTLDKLPNGAYRGSDSAGTVGTVRFLHSACSKQAENTVVVYGEGSYDGKPFVQPLKAQSVLLLRSGSIQESNGRHYITVRIDSFVKIEQMGVELVAKTVQPWITKTADRNFIETLTFVSNFSRTAERNPQGIKRLASRLGAVDQPTRDELVALCFRTAERYAQRDNANRTSSDALVHRADPLLADTEWIKPFDSQGR